MDVREEFQNLLYGTVISSDAQEKDAAARLDALQQWILQHLPKKLYHFSSCSEHAMVNFENSEIWGSKISTFNDPYECTPRYDIGLLWDNLWKNIKIDAFCAYARYIKSGHVPLELEKRFPEEAVHKIDAGIRAIPDSYMDDLEQYLPGLVYNFLRNNIEECVADLFSGFYQAESQKYISCFCEDCTSTLMWGHYADSHKGFCLEYDLSSVVRPCTRRCDSVIGCNDMMLCPAIAPVIYAEKRFDATSHLYSIMQDIVMKKANISGRIYHPDTLLILKCLLTKSKVWSYEKEWRLFSYGIDGARELHGKICKSTPTALYIGANTDAVQAHRLLHICDMNEIPCYKMMLRYGDDNFVVSPVPYREQL